MQTSYRYDGDERLAISEAARRVGVTVATLRRWEADGRISAARTPGGQRRYLASDIEALVSRSAVS